MYAGPIPTFNMAIIDSRLCTQWTTHDGCWIFIAEQNLVGIDAAISADMVHK